jgi:hypothetical protein
MEGKGREGKEREGREGKGGKRREGKEGKEVEGREGNGKGHDRHQTARKRITIGAKPPASGTRSEPTRPQDDNGRNQTVHKRTAHGPLSEPHCS